MFSKLKKKKENEENVVSFKSIKRFEEIITYLKSINQYYSKPYSLKEIENILKREETVSIYFTFKNKKYVIDHIVINNTFLKINSYYLNKVQYNNYKDIFTNEKPFGVSLKDNWKDVKIKIMLDENDQQVL